MDTTLPIEPLRAFAIIAETGSYTLAAERLHRTQPALSLQIKKLEELLNTRLLDRSGRRATPTDAGEVLLTYARRILDLNEEAVSRFAAVNAEGSVRIGVLEEVALGPLFTLLTRFGRLASRVRIELEVATSWDLAKAIRDNRLCLALANAEYAGESDLRGELWDEAYEWVCGVDWQGLDANPIPLIADPMDCHCVARDQALEALERAGRSWDLVFGSTSLSAVQAAARAGLGVGILSRSAITDDLRILGPDDGFPPIPPARIALYRGSKATEEAVDLLAAFLTENLEETGTNPLPSPLSVD